MATRPNRTLKIGEIIDKTVGVVSLSGVPVLAFVLVVGGLSAALDIMAQQMAVPGVIPTSGMLVRTLAVFVLLMIVAFIGSYLMVEAMLKRTGLMTYAGDKRILAFVGMSLLSGLAVGAGFLLLIFPGLFFMARWSIAGPMLIGRGERITASLGKSWEATKGQEFPIVVSSLLIILVFYGIAYAPTFIVGQPTPPLLSVISRMISTAGTATSAAMGVAIYGILSTRNAGQAFE